jgi:transcriptional regulator with XRE-family HTH domain
MRTIAAPFTHMSRTVPEDIDHEVSREASVRDVPAIVGTNLRRLRKAQGLSLERLAELSGVSRAMLGQIETAKSVPTVSLLWRVADALGVPVTTLVATDSEPAAIVLSRGRSSVLMSSGGLYSSRSLTPANRMRATEFFEIHIAAGHRERFPAAALGTRHNLVVAKGGLVLMLGAEPPVALEEGDAVSYEASVAYAYENASLSERTTVYLVVAAAIAP